MCPGQDRDDATSCRLPRRQLPGTGQRARLRRPVRRMGRPGVRWTAPPDSGGERESRPERAGGDVPGRRSEAAEPVRPAEWRTRAEYCDVMRAADGKKVDEADERGGWKEIDAADRPPADGIRMTP